MDGGTDKDSNLRSLKSKTSTVKQSICKCLKIDNISDVKPVQLHGKSGSKQITKQFLAESLLELIRLSDGVLSNIDNINNISDIDHNQIPNADQSSILKCNDKIGNIQSSLLTHTESLTSIESQLYDLKSLVEQLNNKPATQTNNIARPIPQSNVETNSKSNVEIHNSTKCVERCESDFISHERSENLLKFLNNCKEFSTNSESGHSVALFGYPYHYTGSNHTEQPPDIPNIILDIINDIDKLYDNCEINSCLINKYEGCDSYLPRHSDDEQTNDPESLIFTLSLGRPAQIKFTDIFSNDIVTKQIDANSLYVMSRKSQSFWEHQIDTCDCESPHTDHVRYSLTFRHVSKKFNKSTIIIGDSNTYNLKFGEGE